MQSAARVPILVSFEVEDYPGPDHDKIHETAGFIQGFTFAAGFDPIQRRSVTELLVTFSQQWRIRSEEDLHDEEFDVSINENQFEEHMEDVKASSKSMSNLHSILTRQLVIQRSMFQTKLEVPSQTMIALRDQEDS